MFTKTKHTFFSRIKHSIHTILLVLFVMSTSLGSLVFSLSLSPAQAVNLTKGDGILIYGASANTTPQVRTYISSTNTFTTAGSTVSGTAPLSLTTKTSPVRQEAITGYINASGTLQIMCYNGTNYTNEWSVAVGGTGIDRRFDIAYETNTGDVMVLYSTNTATTNELAYRTKSGSTNCGAANWSAATNLDPVRTSGTIHWVKMAWDKRSSSNLITAIWADSASDLSAQVWSGTSWGNEPTTALATTLDVVSVAQDIEDFDVEYESLSGDVKVVWGVAQGNNNPGVRDANCTGGIATCTWSAVATPATFNDDATSLDLSSNPLSDEMVFASVGQDQSDLQIGYWSGTAWTNDANVDGSAVAPGARQKVVTTGWVTLGGTTRSIIAYADNTNTSTSLSFYIGNAGTFTSQTDFVMSPVPGAFRYFDIQQDPYHNDRLLLIYSDANSDLFVKRLVLTAGPTFTWTNADGGSALEASLGQVAPAVFSYVYWRYAPQFDQSAYRIFENNDSTNVGVVTVNPSSGTDFSQSMVSDSQYIYTVGHDSVTVNNQWRIEKRDNTNLNLETGFGTGGVVSNNPTSGEDRAVAVDLDSSNLYIGGYDNGSGNRRWRMEKRTKNTGALDMGFGTFGITTSDPSTNNDFINGVATDSSYIYFLGVDATGLDNKWRIEKRNKSNGALVAGFGSGGVLVYNPSAGDDQPYSAIVAGGHIYVAGYDSSPSNKQLRIEKRSTTTGSLDSGFGVSGAVTVNPGSGDDMWKKIITDGTYLYVAGFDSSAGASDTRWRIEKRNLSDGALVAAFGTSGVVSSNPTSSTDELNSVYLTGSDLYLGGMDTVSGADKKWRIEKRSATTGSLDGSFGAAGVVTTNPGSGTDAARDLIVNSGTLIIAGVGTSSGNNEWRYEKRTTSGTLAKTLAAQNTAAALNDIRDSFRLRMLLSVTQNSYLADQSFKLQFAQKSGSCDVAFSGESYTDVTSSTAIAFFNNNTPVDGEAAVSSTSDPSTGNTILYQTYEESNDFNNTQSTIGVGQDGLWDFALYDKSAPNGTSYCLRAIKSDGSLLDAYSQIPEITTAPGQLSVNIVDTVGSIVSNPLVALTDIVVSKIFQTTTGILGSATEKIRISNTTTTATWALTISSSGGATSLWSSGLNTFDFNDSSANAQDGGDADTQGGQMTIVPSSVTITPQAGCTNTGLSQGSDSAFSEGSIDAVTLLSASGSAGTSCYWDVTSVGVSQTVPLFQPVGTYQRSMTITLTAT